MIRKRVTLFGSALRSISEATTTGRSFQVPMETRAVAKLQGSITATPSMTFQLDAELYT